MQLVKIESQPTEDAARMNVFVLHFIAADGSRPTAALTAMELTSYRQSVALILAQTARMALDHDAEGLPDPQADRFWRLRVSTYLNVKPAAQQAPQQSPLTPPNVN